MSTLRGVYFAISYCFVCLAQLNDRSCEEFLCVWNCCYSGLPAFLYSCLIEFVMILLWYRKNSHHDPASRVQPISAQFATHNSCRFFFPVLNHSGAIPCVAETGLQSVDEPELVMRWERTAFMWVIQVQLASCQNISLCSPSALEGRAKMGCTWCSNPLEGATG